jgi:hypothetical protein
MNYEQEFSENLEQGSISIPADDYETLMRTGKLVLAQISLKEILGDPIPEEVLEWRSEYGYLFNKCLLTQ